MILFFFILNSFKTADNKIIFGLGSWDATIEIKSFTYASTWFRYKNCRKVRKLAKIHVSASKKTYRKLARLEPFQFS